MNYSSIKKKRLGLVLVLTAISEIINKIVPFLIIHIGQSQLGMAGFGVANFSIYLIDAMIPFITFGYPAQGMLTIGQGQSSDRVPKTLGEISVLRLGHAVVMALLLNGFLWLVPGYEPYRLSAGVLTVALFAAAIESVYILSGLQKIHILILTTMAVKILSLFAVYAVVDDADDILLYVFFSYGANILIALIPFLYIIRQHGFSWPKRQGMIQLFRKSLPFGVCGVLLALSDRVELFVLESMITPEQLGAYTGIYRIQQSIFPIFAALGTAFLAEMLSTRDKESLTQHARLLLLGLSIICFPASVGIFFVDEQVIHLILDHRYSSMAQNLSLLVIALCFHAYIIIFAHQTLLVQRRISPLNKILFLALPLQIVSAFIMVNIWHLSGGVLSLLFSKVVLSVFLVVMTLRKLTKLSMVRDLISIIIATLLMAIVLVLLGEKASLTIKMVFAVLSYTSILLILNKSIVVKILSLRR